MGPFLNLLENTEWYERRAETSSVPPRLSFFITAPTLQYQLTPIRHSLLRESYKLFFSATSAIVNTVSRSSVTVNSS